MSGPSSSRCMEIADSGQHAVIQAAQEWAYAHQVPLNVSLELTLRCNIRCKHCYNFDRDTPLVPTDELTRAEILTLLEDLHRLGCLFVYLTGGEVFTHPLLFDVMDHARTLGMAVQLLTNGTMLTPAIVERLATYPNLLGTSISVYGGTAEGHDGITQVPGSFQRTWDGARRLREAGIPARIKFVIMKPVVGEVERMIARAESEGFSYLVDLTITGRHDGTSGSLDMRVSPEEVERLYRGPLRGLVAKAGGAVTEENFPCNCARANLAITSTGDVQPCISVPWTAGNIREASIEKIWRESPVFRKIRGYSMSDYPHCAPCPLKSSCSREKGAAYIASGDYTGIDPWICKTAEITDRLAKEPVAK